MTRNIAITLLVIVLSFKTSAGQKGSIEKLKWYDLTYPFSEKTLYWPNNPRGFEFDTLFEGHTHGGYYYSSFSFFAPEHGGTHLDAPIHFAEGKKTNDQLSLDQLMGEGVVVDVSVQALKDRDYRISVEDLLAWEKKNGSLKPDVIVLFRTGYGDFYPDAKKYFGTDLKGEEAIPHLHFPGLSNELASFLVTRRKVKAVGIDVASIDYGQSKDFMVHRILLKENIPVFENVANLGKLPATNIYIIALPMLIEGGSGGPLRIVAGVKK